MRHGWTEETIAARLLHRDGLMLVIDKPAGLAVHAGPGKGAHLEMYLGGLRFGLPRPPALAHRLDRDTSGCLALGRHAKALSRLGRLFQEGRIGKTYWAVLEGAPPGDEGLVEAPLRKVTGKTGWRMVVDDQGQASATRWRVIGRGFGLAFVAFEPLTGRTHQIRVHAAHLGCPVLGDPTYGKGRDGAPGRPGATPLHLHSRRLVVPLRQGQPAVDVTAPVPDHMVSALKLCGWTGEEDAAGTIEAPAD